MEKIQLLRNLNRVELLSKSSKWVRVLTHPIRSLIALFAKGSKQAPLFFNKKISMLLPQDKEMFIIKGKGSDADIRLARCMILELKKGDTFIDLQPQGGYFCILAAEIAGSKGDIIALEGEEKYLPISKANAADIAAFQALSYSVNESSNFLQDIMVKGEITPQAIKLSAQHLPFLLQQAHPLFTFSNAPMLWIEVPAKGDFAPLQKLADFGYVAHYIANTGEVERIENLAYYATEKITKHDYLLFKKK